MSGKRRGIAVLEGIATLALVIGITAVAAKILHGSLTQIWLEHVLYESLICRAENRPHSQCEAEAMRKSRILPLGIENVHLRFLNHGEKWQGELKWRTKSQTNGSLRLTLAMDEVGGAGSRRWRSW